MPSETHTRYVIFLTKFHKEDTPQPLVQAHVQYLKNLEEKDRLVLAGPYADNSGGMVMIKADNIETAIEIAREDPFVKSGSRSFEVNALLLACKENNYLDLA